MSGPAAALPAPRRRSVGALLFDVILLTFAGVIVGSAAGISARAGLVPLVIGIPTLVGLLYVLVRDLIGRPAPESGHATLDAEALRTSSVDGTLVLAAEELHADADLPRDEESRRRQATLAIWIVGFVALAALTNFRVAAPVALIVILLITTRRIIDSVVMTAVASVFLYLVFDVLLDVAF